MTVINKQSSLEEILSHVWNMLNHGNMDKQHPYRYPALATYGSEGIQQRTVVLRAVDTAQRTLTTYSDLRTQKVADLSFHPQASWLFYDQQAQEQIRVSSQVAIHHQDKQAMEIWQKIPLKGRADYIGPHPPGASFQHHIANLPADFMEEPNEENTAPGIEHFCLLQAKVQSIEFLKLMKDGHLRAGFIWQQKSWGSRWIAP